MTRMFAAFALAAAMVLGTLALADDYRVGDLSVDQPWARASIGRGRVGAAYFTLSNHGLATDRLVAVATPMAMRASLHTHLMESGVMKMRPVAAIEVAPGEPAVLKPGGLHVMLMGLRGSSSKTGASRSPSPSSRRAPLRSGSRWKSPAPCNPPGSPPIAATDNGPEHRSRGDDALSRRAI